MDKTEVGKQFVEAALDAFSVGRERGGGKRITFNRSTFFHRWLRTPDHAFAFVFKDSLAVTNIQVAELISLVEHYGSNALHRSKAAHQLSFSTQQDFYAAIAKFIEPITHLPIDDQVKEIPHDLERTIEQHLENIWTAYSDLIATSTVLEVYQATACLFLPPTIVISLDKISAAAGYVLGCGPLVYVRNSMRATYSEFTRELKAYLKERSAKGSRPVFEFYFKELFPKDPTEAPALDGLKFWADKSALGDIHFATIEEQLRDDFREALVFGDAGSDGSQGKTRSSTIWMVMDQAPATRLEGSQSDTKYFLVFEQTHRNSNPLDFFDENKPAWLTQTTMPHRLYRAMVNLTKPWKNERHDFYLCDPFCGTGTGAYESAGHFGARLHFHGGDAEDVLRYAWDDNARFFRDAKSAKAALSIFRGLSQRGLDEMKGDLIEALELLGKYESAEPERVTEARTRLTSALDGLKYEGRLRFWVCVRAFRRVNSRVDELLTTRGDSLIRSFAKDLVRQTRRYLTWLEQASEPSSRGSVQRLKRLEFSTGMTYSAQDLAAALEEATTQLRFGDSARMGGPGAVPLRQRTDMIVSDPPYGFNTVEDSSELMHVYGEFLDQAVQVLDNGGHLVLCLPDTSYVGKSFPFFTVPSLVTTQVLAIAEKHDRVAYVEARSLPAPRSFFAPPYYWKSARALKRAILHFRIVKKKDML